MPVPESPRPALPASDRTATSRPTRTQDLSAIPVNAQYNVVVNDGRRAGFDNAAIKAAYEHAKASGKYDKVERWHGKKGCKAD